MKLSNKGFIILDRHSKLDDRRHLTGFTLIEILIAVIILTFCICGLLATYVNMFFLSDLSRDFTLATSALQAKMEEIKKTNFTELKTSLSGPFNLTDYGLPILESKGRIEIQENFNGYTDLTKIRIIACFKSRGRLIGEDKNLNGSLNLGEDTIVANGRLDSPVELVTLIAK